ncbi:MAG TPA: FGGY family carbohydrate kinase, partial [Brevefilum fermentans]|nr:FGGY family carbohydrate kinase [Brevefilum fermentans]
MANYVMAIDQGTTSTRVIVFNHQGEVIGIKQKEHEQHYPKPGWVEHDPLEIWSSTQLVVQGVLNDLNLTPNALAAIGITNQRETTLVWDRETGKPYYPAIVWQDTRTDKLCNELAKDFGQDRFRQVTGLPLATYFSGPKIAWMLKNVP